MVDGTVERRKRSAVAGVCFWRGRIKKACGWADSTMSKDRGQVEVPLVGASLAVGAPWNPRTSADAARWDRVPSARCGLLGGGGDFLSSDQPGVQPATGSVDSVLTVLRKVPRRKRFVPPSVRGGTIRPCRRGGWWTMPGFAGDGLHKAVRETLVSHEA